MLGEKTAGVWGELNTEHDPSLVYELWDRPSIVTDKRSNSVSSGNWLQRDKKDIQVIATNYLKDWGGKIRFLKAKAVNVSFCTGQRTDVSHEICFKNRWMSNLEELCEKKKWMHVRYSSSLDCNISYYNNWNKHFKA